MTSIEKIRIKNIMSVGETIEIELGRRVTVLVGPNNTGKSNILKALRLVLNTSNDKSLPPETINEEAKRWIEAQEEPVLDPFASVEIDYTLDDQSRNEVVDAAYRVLKSNYKKQYPENNPPWYEVKKALWEYGRKLFPNVFSISVEISRRSAGEYHTSGHREPFFQKWNDMIETYTRSWKQIFLNAQCPNPSLRSELEAMFGRITRRGVEVHRDLLPNNPPIIQAGGTAGEPPRANEIRAYYHYLNDPSTQIHGPERAILTVKELVRDAFSEIKDLEPSFDVTTGQPKLWVRRGSGNLEIGTQGDGLKRLLLFIAYMHNLDAHIITADEPENHLHPSLEPQIINFFLQHGRGQLMLATHSETIVGSIPREAIESGDVTIYGVTLDDDNCTRVERGKDSNIIRFLDNLGVPISRYMKHMAALSNSLLFVEGPSDAKLITAILKEFERYDEFQECHPFFIHMGGVEETSKIRVEVLDLIAKGEDSLETPPVPILVIRDRDEEDRPERPHELVLSVREIENVVLSENSIKKMAEDYLKRVVPDSPESHLETFEMQLSESIEKYLYRWAVLKLRSSLERCIRPMLKKRLVSEDWRITRDEAESMLKRDRLIVEGKLKELGTVFSSDELDSTYNSLKQECLHDRSSPNYEFIAKRIPGKDFITYVLHDALIATALTLRAPQTDTSEKDEKRRQELAISLCSAHNLLRFVDELPQDLDRLLEKMKEFTQEG